MDQILHGSATTTGDSRPNDTAWSRQPDACGHFLATVTLEEVQQHPDMLLWLKQGHGDHEAHGDR